MKGLYSSLVCVCDLSSVNIWQRATPSADFLICEVKLLPLHIKAGIKHSILFFAQPIQLFLNHSFHDWAKRVYKHFIFNCTQALSRQCFFKISANSSQLCPSMFGKLPPKEINVVPGTYWGYTVPHAIHVNGLRLNAKQLYRPGAARLLFGFLFYSQAQVDVLFSLWLVAYISLCLQTD